MSDSKAGDRIDNQQKAPEAQTLKAPDAQEARTAGASDMAAVQNTRTNSSDGSLRQYARLPTAEQENSLEVVSGNTIISRDTGLTEKQLLTSDNAKAKLEHLSQTAAELAAKSKENPVLEPVAKLRKYADSLPPSENKDALIKLSREQAGEISPEMKRRFENIQTTKQLIEDGGFEKAGVFNLKDLQAKAKEHSQDVSGVQLASGEGERKLDIAQAETNDNRNPQVAKDTTQPENRSQGGAKELTNTPDGWMEVAHKISQLPLQQQIELIGTALTTGSDRLQWEQHERFWGSVIGSVQGIGEVAVNLAKITDFAAALLKNDQATAGKMEQEFKDSLGQTITGGIKLFEAAEKYSYDVGYSGDYAKPFKDIVALGQALDQKWEGLSPREQERIKAKLVTELLADGAIGGGAAHAIGKAGKLTEILDTVAGEARSALGTRSKKILHAVNETIDSVTSRLTGKPKLAQATAYGGEVAGTAAAEESATSALINESRVFPSKFDPAAHLTPKEAAIENARIKKIDFDEKAWNKLKPEEKAEFLKEQGYIEKKVELPVKKPANPEEFSQELDKIKERPPGPIEPNEALKRVESIRNSLNFKGGNVAIAQTEIDGEISSYAATSGEQQFAGTVPSPKDRLFKVTEFSGAQTRAFDSELKLLEDLAHKLPKSAHGTIYLFSERTPCKSCKLAIEEFEKMFPGVKVVVRDGKKGAL